MRSILFKGALILIIYSCNSSKPTNNIYASLDAYSYTGTKKTESSNGAVVSAHPIASQVGISIMKLGGNAFDAAIATQLALAVVYPNAGNIGGGGFMVAHLANGKNLALDYREMAPASASRDMYIDNAGNARTDKSQEGHLASGIPGTVAGLFASLQYARLPFKVLIQPAIDLAEKGYAISASEARSFNGTKKDFEKNNTVKPVFVRDQSWKAGDTLQQPELAETLKRMQRDGAKGFYEGETARLIVEEMKRGGGIITLNDLKDYKAKFRESHLFNYKGYQVIGMPMPSSGGLLLHQMMRMVESRNISSMGFLSPQAVQLMIEVERRAYADRAEYMGDKDFYNVPVNALTADAYLVNRMKDYDPLKAGISSKIKPGLGATHESKETTHLSIIDKDGNAVAVTTTLNGSFGSKTVVGGAGFLLNNEMDDFSIKPGVPNMYGAVGGEANSIAAGKRMLSSMTPTIVLKDGKPYIVAGTPGGTTIPTSVFQTLIDMLEFNMSTEDAVNKPKFHHQWLPDEVSIEHDFPVATQAALEKMGYKIVNSGSLGRTEVIKVLPNGKFEAVADKRGDDAAAGW